VRRALERVFEEFGLPEAIRSDNGAPFASRGLGGLSELSLWWHRIGIRHERIEPGHPEQNGRHERMHRDLKLETTRPPAKTLKAQQRLFDRFRARFNDERPHEAIGQRCPAEFYRRSKHELPDPPWGRRYEYEWDDDIARVSKLGYVSTPRGSFFLSTTFADELLLLDWTERNRARIVYRNIVLGEIRAERKRGRVRFVPVEKLDLWPSRGTTTVAPPTRTSTVTPVLG
jgi:hypothetical protein